MSSDFGDGGFVEMDENDVDVVIVGAGLTGLTCAYNILKRRTGIEVLIVEATNEVGGRVLSEFSETFHANSLQRHVTDLLDSLHIQTYPRWNINNKKRMFYTKGGRTESFPKCYSAEVFNFLQVIQENSVNSNFNSYEAYEDVEELTKISVEQLIRRLVHFPFARSLCRIFICSICATRSLDDVSALWLLFTLNGAGGLINQLRVAMGDNNRYFVQGGMSRMVLELQKRILEEGGKIRCGELVKEIQFNDYRTYVVTETNCFKCDLVVVAVPPPQSNRILIQPSASSLKSPSPFVCNKNVFFNVVYEEPFWGNDYTGDVLTTWDRNTNLNLAYGATHNEFVLAGYLDQSESTESSQKGLFETLNECFENTDAVRCMRYKEFDQRKYDRTASSQGTSIGCPMTVLKPCPISEFVPYGFYERIFFASSETADNWPGTLDGAIQAGEITALSVLSIVRPQSLTFRDIISTVPRRKKKGRSFSFAIAAVQYLGLALNIGIFISFSKTAYNGSK